MSLRSWDVWDEKLAQELLRKWGYPKKNEDSSYHKLLLKATELCVGKSVLDVGCGFGQLAYYLAPNISYLGVDSSEAMLKKARKLNQNLHLKLADVYDLSSLGNYDTVYAMSLLIHLPDLKEPLEELCEHANKSVVLSLFVKDFDSITIKNQVIRRFASMHTLERVFRKIPKIREWKNYTFEDPRLNYTRIFRLCMHEMKRIVKGSDVKKCR